MHTSVRRVMLVASMYFSSSASAVSAQSTGSAGTLSGIVTDPSGAIAAGVVVTLFNPVNGYSRTPSSPDC